MSMGVVQVLGEPGGADEQVTIGVIACSHRSWPLIVLGFPFCIIGIAIL
jgi:hypothetical protein